MDFKRCVFNLVLLSAVITALMLFIGLPAKPIYYAASILIFSMLSLFILRIDSKYYNLFLSLIVGIILSESLYMYLNHVYLLKIYDDNMIKTMLEARDNSDHIFWVIGKAIFALLPIFFGLVRCKNINNFAEAIPSLNLDLILPTDQEWITDIKTRKQKGEKLNAYSKEGATAAKRKARALGLEDCFMKFLGEEEIKERRGW